MAEFYGDSELYGEVVRDRKDKQRPPLKVRAYRKSSNQEAGGDKANVASSCKPRWRRVQMGLRIERQRERIGAQNGRGGGGDLTLAGNEKEIRRGAGWGDSQSDRVKIYRESYDGVMSTAGA